MPSDPPTSMPQAIATKPTVSEMRAPQMVRLNMSREQLVGAEPELPRRGVGRTFDRRSMYDFSGSLSGSHGARIAASDDERR